MELLWAALVGLAHATGELVAEALEGVVRGRVRRRSHGRNRDHTREELEAASPRRALEEPDEPR